MLGVIAIGCGAAAARPVEPVAETTAPPAEVLSGPTEPEVIIDGVRDGMLLDERDGLRLVLGAGTLAIVDASGHVRLSHRIAFGGVVEAAFSGVDDVVVQVTEELALRWAYAGLVVRWHLPTDTFEPLAGARLGEIGRIGGSDTVLVTNAYALEDIDGDGDPHLSYGAVVRGEWHD